VDLEHFQDGNLADIRKEINIMSSCLHKNLCRYYVSFMDDSDLWMVMPLLGAGSVVDIIKLKYPKGIKDEAMIATILKEVLEGVLYLHNQCQIHRDIKAGNILMDENGEILLCDFGVSAHIKVGQPRTTFVGSPCWMAPEVMEQTEGYDFMADIWSLGITALELAMGDAPNSELPAMRVLLVIINSPPPHLPKNEEWSPEFYHFIECCLQKDPSKRVPTQDLMKENKKFFDKA
jgi:serine/threonine-protein kinase OSR1/STK39